MPFSPTPLPNTTSGDRHIAWCLREVLSGGLTTKAAYRALVTRFEVFLGKPAPAAMAFMSLVAKCQADGTPEQYRRATGDYDASDVLRAQQNEIAEAARRGSAQRRAV